MSNNTKQLLAQSLKKLMSKTSLDHITVKDLVTDCGVNRQTFYYHFQDIYELLGWIYKSEALASINNCKSYDTWQLGFLKIFQYVEQNRAFCLSTFHSLGREHLESFLNNVVFSLLMGVLDEIASLDETKGMPPLSLENKQFIARFYTFGFAGLMLDWLRLGVKERPEAIADKLSKLVEGDFSRAIAKYRE